MIPRLLDLCCGAGGASRGYSDAGFEVTGVDIDDHPDYPYPFIKADALKVAADMSFLSLFDVVAASFPCPRYSVATPEHRRQGHPDLVPAGRDLLKAWGGIYVLENVPGAPLLAPALICGAAMGLAGIRRHRLFESNVFLMTPGCACDAAGSVSVFGHSGEDRRRATLAANGGMAVKHVPLGEVRSLLGVPWMTRRSDISDAIPPAYTEFIGHQLLEAL